MIKRILVGIDTSEHSRVAQAYAFTLARRLRSTLIGLHVVDIVLIEGSFFHDISGSLGLEPYLDFSSKMREVLTARGRAVVDEFCATARREKIAAEPLIDMGVVANQICERAKAADLVMIGHRGIHERFSTGLLGSTAESVASKSPRPVFVSPKRLREIKNLTLAYDGAPAQADQGGEFCCFFPQVPQVSFSATYFAPQVSQQSMSLLPYLLKPRADLSTRGSWRNGS
jgi:nucleotide-binding universal stress UspA family protein